MAVLKESGKVPSVMEKLIRVVIGIRRESMQDLSSLVGIRSREHVALDEDRMALRTSSVVAGKNSERGGGGKRGGGFKIWYEADVRGLKREQRLTILLSKNWRKEEARV